MGSTRGTMPKKKTLEAFAEGQQARFCGKPKAANPYPADDERHGMWRDGWDAAADPGNARVHGYN